MIFQNSTTQKILFFLYNLYEKFRSTDALGLVTTQFLASLNAYFGRDINISKDAMTEFYHNLSMQTPLSVSNHSVKMNFASITNLVKKINILIRKEILKFKKMKRADNKIIDNGITDYENTIGRSGRKYCLINIEQ